MSVKRIVSLLPAATEIIAALGLENQLIGRSGKCDCPLSVKKLPVCISQKNPIEKNSQLINGPGKITSRYNEPVYSLDKELICRLGPDLIIVQDNEAENVSGEIMEVLPAAKLLPLRFQSLSDLFSSIETLSGYLAAEAQGFRLSEDLQERIELIRHKLKFIDKKPKTACIERLSPLSIGGSLIRELIKAAGGEPAWTENGKPMHIDTSILTAADPEIILIAPSGFSISRTLQEIHLLAEQPGWNELNAVVNNQVYIADGSQYFNRPGLRSVDSIEILAEILNPKQFAFGYEGEGWIKFDFNLG